MPKANVSTALFVLEILLLSSKKRKKKHVNSKLKSGRGLLLRKLGGLKPAGGISSLWGHITVGGHNMKRRATAGPISTPAQLRHLRDKEGSTPPGSLRFIPLPIQCPHETLGPKATDHPL